MFNGENFISDFTVRTEINERIFAARRLDIIELDFFERAFSGSGLLGLRCVRGKAGDELLEFFDFFFFFLVGFLHLADHQLGRFIPEIIVAGIERDFPVIDVGNIGADLVQEIPVMRNDNDRIREINQKFLKPGDRIQIEVVGRLVQKKNVGIAEKGSRKQYLYFLRAV